MPEKSKVLKSKVLYSATANEIRTYGECVLNVNFNTPQNYSWNFTKIDLNFSIIGLNFHNTHKLTIDVYNCCLVDKENDLTIPLSPASVHSPKLCCIVSELSEFHQIQAKHPNILKCHKHARILSNTTYTINDDNSIRWLSLLTLLHAEHDIS